MGVFERGAHLRLGQLGVAQRGADVAVPEHALDDLHAHALADQLAATRVPELVQRVAGRAGGVDEAGPRAEPPHW